MAHTSGGRVQTTIGGTVYAARGEITISGSNMEVSSAANQDGSSYRTVAPRVRSAELTFDQFVDDNGTPLRWSDNIMSLTGLGVTFTEMDGKVTHLLSGCFFVGTPANNLATGEISGLSLAGDVYKTIEN